MKFIKDLGIHPLESFGLVISWKFNASIPGQYSKKEFCKGMQLNRCFTIEDARKYNKWGIPYYDEDFTELYRFAFQFN